MSQRVYSVAGRGHPILLHFRPDKVMWLKRQLGAREISLSPLGNLETEVMERTWERGEISVRDLHQELAGRLAYTTVMTTLDRLYKKGMLSRRKLGKAYLYSPAFTKVEYQGRLTQHVLGIALEDRKYSGAVLSRFVDAVTAADTKMLDELDELVKAKRRALRSIPSREARVGDPGRSTPSREARVGDPGRRSG